MQTFFTSDHHFGHKNILTLGKGRPFLSMEEMETELIDRWNSVVSDGDMVYYLGDFAFRSDIRVVDRTLSQLNGRKYLIAGNHDNDEIRKMKSWESVWEYKEIKVKKQKIVLFHYPMREWNGSWRGAWQLHGHCHGNLADDPYLKSIDIGIDCHDYTPISFEQVGEIMSKKLERE